MFDQIMELTKGDLGDILQKNNIPMDKLDAVMSVAGGSLKQSIEKESRSGNVGALSSLFSTNENEDGGLMDGIIGSLTFDLTEKLGLSGDSASGIAKAMLPMIIKKFAGKFADKDVPFNLDAGGIAGMFADGDSGNMLDKAKGMLGGLFGK